MAKRSFTGPSPEIVELVLGRDNWSCVCCGKSVAGGERGRDWSVHHRIPRGMGGSRDPRLNLPANLMILCGSGTTGCHNIVERRRNWARERGLILWRSQEPDQIAVAVYQEGDDPLFCSVELVLLDNSGRRRLLDEEMAS